MAKATQVKNKIQTRAIDTIIGKDKADVVDPYTSVYQNNELLDLLCVT